VREEVRGGCRKLHNEDLYALLNIVRVVIQGG
jgi:hypothetical protein